MAGVLFVSKTTLVILFAGDFTYLFPCCFLFRGDCGFYFVQSFLTKPAPSLTIWGKLDALYISEHSEARGSPGSYLKDLCEDADKDNSGTITAEEFLKALVTGKVAFNYLKESLNKGVKEMKQNECDPWQSNKKNLVKQLQELLGLATD